MGFCYWIFFSFGIKVKEKRSGKYVAKIDNKYPFGVEGKICRKR
jgi:hypothetical protein